MVKIKIQTSKIEEKNCGTDRIVYITEHFCGAQNESEYAFESVTEVLFCQGIHLSDLHVSLQYCNNEQQYDFIGEQTQ